MAGYTPAAPTKTGRGKRVSIRLVLQFSGASKLAINDSIHVSYQLLISRWSTDYRIHSFWCSMGIGSCWILAMACFCRVTLGLFTAGGFSYGHQNGLNMFEPIEPHQLVHPVLVIGQQVMKSCAPKLFPDDQPLPSPAVLDLLWISNWYSFYMVVLTNKGSTWMIWF